MAQEWYYQQNGQKHGPISGADLKQLVVAGKLQPTDLIWKEGMAKWVPARSVKGLFPAAAPSTSRQGVKATATKPATAPAQVEEVVEAKPAAIPSPLSTWVGKWQGLSMPVKVGIIGGGGIMLLLLVVVPVLLFVLSGRSPSRGPVAGQAQASDFKGGPDERPVGAGNAKLPGDSPDLDPRFADLPKQDFSAVDYTKGPSHEELTVQASTVPDGEFKGHKRRATGFKRAGRFVQHGVTTIWYPSGQKKSERHYVNGKEHGRTTFWHENGQKQAEFYISNGKNADGVAVWWFDNGRKKSEKAYRNGRGNGPEVLYWPNGQKRREATFEDGYLSGSVTYWSPNGVKRQEQEWVKRHGCWMSRKWYANDGSEVPRAPVKELCKEEFLAVIRDVLREYPNAASGLLNKDDGIFFSEEEFRKKVTGQEALFFRNCRVLSTLKFFLQSCGEPDSGYSRQDFAVRQFAQQDNHDHDWLYTCCDGIVRLHVRVLQVSDDGGDGRFAIGQISLQ